LETLVKKYADKLVQAGLADTNGCHSPLVGGLDDILTWNRDGHVRPVLEQVFAGLNINSLVCLTPVEPYSTLILHLAGKALSTDRCITPTDCETRTFLHDLPVIDQFDAKQIIAVLKNRKSVIVVPGHHTGSSLPVIIAHGTISPEQGFVTISSVCFAAFIKFFTDYLAALKTGTATMADHQVFDRGADMIPDYFEFPPVLAKGPFLKADHVYAAIIEAGSKMVEYGLVDSYFGNVSYCWQDTIYISQTGSSLDELAGCIDPVPLDHSTSAGLTASSELSAHLKSIEMTGSKAILHGHPKFSVILSMDCEPEEKNNCEYNKQCHIKCPKKRRFKQTPIVPGEVGTGPFGLCHTLPEALTQSDSAIVYGHGLFTTSKKDFTHAFNTMLEIEIQCRKNYLEQVNNLR
jgi:ribulose-5-phosphate 4-epimerase/fuculose-1-phosphate aldolase